MESNSVCNHTSDKNFWEKKNTKVWKEKICIKSFYTIYMVIETKVVIGWFKLQLKMWLVDLNYNFEKYITCLFTNGLLLYLFIIFRLKAQGKKVLNIIS